MSVTTVDHHTGGRTFELDPEDPLGTGFVLR